MALDQKQQNLIVAVDQKVKTILANGGSEKTLLVELLDFMPGIKSLLDTAPKKEIEMYFYEYDGFYRYLKMLENLAQGFSDGRITA